MTITISLLSRGPCIYRPIQRKYGEYDHKLLDRLGSGEIARTICSCAYHKRGGSSYVIGVAFAPNHASRSHLSFPPSHRLSFLGQFAFQLINTSLSVLSLPLSSRLARDHRRNRIDQTNRFLIPLFSSLVRSLLSLSPSFLFPSLPSLLFLLFISAARGFLEFRTAFQRTPPDHRPLSISCSGTQTRSCGPPFLDQSTTVQPWGIRGPRQGLPRGFLPLRNRVCKTLFLDEFKRNGTSRKLRR